MRRYFEHVQIMIGQVWKVKRNLNMFKRVTELSVYQSHTSYVRVPKHKTVLYEGSEGSSSIMYHNPQYGVKPRHSGGGPVAIRPVRHPQRLPHGLLLSNEQTGNLGTSGSVLPTLVAASRQGF